MAGDEPTNPVDRVLALIESERAQLLGYFEWSLPKAVDPEEALQELMIRAVAGVEGLRDQDKLENWLHCIAANVADDLRSDWRKRNKRQETGHQSFEDDAVAPHQGGAEKTPLQQNQDEERKRRIREALDKLPAEERLVCELSYFRGIPHSEIAKLPGWNLAKVKNRIRSGTERLGEILGDVDL